MLPDLELGTVFEENGNGNEEEEEEESEGKGPKRSSDGDEGWNNTNQQVSQGEGGEEGEVGGGSKRREREVGR